MRRDPDYLRELLVEMEESDEWRFHLLPKHTRPSIDSKREYHIRLLAKDGLIAEDGPGVFWMTPRGHDFLDHTRDEAIWRKTKDAAGKVRDYSVSMLMRIAEGYVRAMLREITGLDI